MNYKCFIFVCSIFVLITTSLYPQSYHYDAKYLGTRIQLNPSTDEIMVRFVDSISQHEIEYYEISSERR